MLIKCPECGKEISDRAVSCIHCGFPLEDKKQEKIALSKRRCVNCGHENSADALQCEKCRRTFEFGGYVPIGPIQNDRDLFIQKYSTPCCPKCGGKNYHAFIDEVVLQEGKSTGKVSLNLNPLKPFTIFNYKEKIVRKPVIMQVSKFICDDCGNIFS